jgi:PPOX class probable F420-dependent enzyme
MSPELAQAQYINLTTFRKDGREVATPVWCVALDGKLYFYTVGTSGKVKRIRATKKVRVAPSDGRGKPLGAWADGTGRIVSESALEQRIYRALAAKYGWQFRILDAFAWIARRQHLRVTAELSL